MSEPIFGGEDSPALLKLRILTGRHAGGELFLTQGSKRIGNESKGDIVISDWPYNDSSLFVQQDGGITLQLNGGTDEKQILVPLEPLLVGSVAIAVAPASVSWPADVDLLRRLFLPRIAIAEDEAEENLKSKRPETAKPVRWAAGAAAVLALLGFSTSVLSSRDLDIDIDAQDQDQFTARHSLQDILRELNLNELRVEKEADGHTILLQGWLAQSAQYVALQKALGRNGLAGIRHAYVVAEDLAALVHDRLAEPDVRITYRGNGHFNIEGKISNHRHAATVIRQLTDELRQIPATAQVRFEGAAFTDVSAQTLLAGEGSAALLYLGGQSVEIHANGARQFRGN